MTERQIETEKETEGEGWWKKTCPFPSASRNPKAILLVTMFHVAKSLGKSIPLVLLGAFSLSLESAMLEINLSESVRQY